MNAKQLAQMIKDGFDGKRPMLPCVGGMLVRPIYAIQEHDLRLLVDAVLNNSVTIIEQFINACDDTNPQKNIKLMKQALLRDVIRAIEASQ